MEQPYAEADGAVCVDLRTLAYWGPVLVWAMLIFFFSSVPRLEAYVPFLNWTGGDKAAHALGYGFLSVLCYRALRGASGPWAARHAFVLALAVSTAYGLADEWHQYFVPFRTMDARDLMADMAGSLVAMLGWRQVIGLR